MSKFDYGTQFGLLGFIDPLILLRLIKHLPSVSPRRLVRLLGVLGAGVAMQPLVLAEKIQQASRRSFKTDATPQSSTEVAPPVFIIGHWRSGTTHLHNLLSQDEQFGCVRMFESVAPQCSLVSNAWLPAVMSRIMPTKRPMDNLGWPMDAPQEDEIALAKLTPFSWYLQFMFPQNAIATFQEYVLLNGASAKAKSEVQRHLRHIFDVALRHEVLAQTQPLSEPKKRLLLKNPVHTARLPLLLEMFPDARFVYLHRSPLEVFVSSKNLHRKILELTSMQRYSETDIERNVLELYPQLVGRYLKDRNLLGPGQLVELGFADLETNPLQSVELIYRKLALPGYDQAAPRIAAYVESQSSYQKNNFERPSARVEELVRERWSIGFEAGGYAQSTPTLAPGLAQDSLA